MTEFRDSGSLTTDKRTVDSSTQWATQAEWEAFQEANQIEIINGTVQLESFDPSAIPDSGLLHTHWNPRESSTVTTSGSTVTGISDLEANVDLTGTATAIEQINGVDAIRFNGTDNILDGLWSGTVSTPFTVALVEEMQVVNLGATDTDIQALLGGSADGYDGSANVAEWEGDYHHFNGTTLRGDIHDTNPHIRVVVFDGANSLVEVDNSQILSGDAGARSLMDGQPFSMGAYIGADGSEIRHANTRLGESLIWDARLDSAARSDAHDYLADAYGLA